MEYLYGQPEWQLEAGNYSGDDLYDPAVNIPYVAGRSVIPTTAGEMRNLLMGEKQAGTVTRDVERKGYGPGYRPWGESIYRDGREYVPPKWRGTVYDPGRRWNLSRDWRKPKGQYERGRYGKQKDFERWLKRYGDPEKGSDDWWRAYKKAYGNVPRYARKVRGKRRGGGGDGDGEGDGQGGQQGLTIWRP
jgi:hypothetical protein